MQRGTSLKYYADRPVRDSPDNMPWDCSLNQDVYFSADFHVTMTNHMVRYEDGRFPQGKFDISTPNREAHAYCRMLNPETGGFPSSERIIKDVEKVFESTEIVRKYEGIKTNSIGNWKRKRQEATCQ